MMMSSVLRYFESSNIVSDRFVNRIRSLLDNDQIDLIVENCYYIVVGTGDIDRFEANSFDRLNWLLTKHRQSTLSKVSALANDDDLIEIGPRLTFTTAYSTNAVSACHAAGLTDIIRLEKSTRYRIAVVNGGDHCWRHLRTSIVDILSDRMTECEYDPIRIPEFRSINKRQNFFRIDVLESIDNLIDANIKFGLAFDESDLSYYYDLFVNQLRRNPTDVELFDLAQSNSEHSRHWFFKGDLIIDGCRRPKSLFNSVQQTQLHSNRNSIIAFRDNSSCIRGYSISNFVSIDGSQSSELQFVTGLRHIIYTAETHNFPTAVCPFPGAATGTGGRIRDVHATGRGAHEIAGVVGYSFGNVHIPGYALPWEYPAVYPDNFAHPRDVIIQASNGASDYANKFGEPVVTGFARSFGQLLTASGDRCEYVKPIMFSGGVGSIDDEQTEKVTPKAGMLIAKIGGPVYRIGVGGGAASSVFVQGGESGREKQLDFGAVQRGDAEMEQKLHRVIRACVECSPQMNPILSIHDQGAGGNGNVLKEIVDANGCGAQIDADRFELGDATISIRELWTAEYQESDAILIASERRDFIEKVCERERCTLAIVGIVTDDSRVRLSDFNNDNHDQDYPVDFDLTKIGSRSPKTFILESKRNKCEPLSLPDNLTVRDALDRVLRHPTVASKRYLTNKVDRCVTGLVAQQSCVGCLHTPVADVGVTALSFVDTVLRCLCCVNFASNDFDRLRGFICVEC